MTTPIDSLPDDLFVDIAHIGFFAVPLDVRADQHQARGELRFALARGPVENVAEALSHIAQAWQTDVHGKKIPLSKNVIVRTASQLAIEINGWLDEQTVTHA